MPFDPSRNRVGNALAQRNDRTRSALCVGFFVFCTGGPGKAFAMAPSVPMFGSYFPSWLLCLFAGVMLTVIVRVIFIMVGLDDVLRWRVPAYMSMAVGLTFLLSLTIFGR